MAGLAGVMVLCVWSDGSQQGDAVVAPQGSPQFLILKPIFGMCCKVLFFVCHVLF